MNAIHNIYSLSQTYDLASQTVVVSTRTDAEASSRGHVPLFADYNLYVLTFFRELDHQPEQLSKEQICSIWHTYRKQQLVLRYFYDLQFKKEGATQTASKAGKTKQPAKDAVKAFPHRKFVELNSKICSEIQELENLEANFQSKYRETLVNVLNFYLGTCGLEKKQPKYFK
jgi:hypothetical protein